MSNVPSFLSKIKFQEGGINACWEWSGAKDKDGYGHIEMIGERRAHRISYRLFNGNIHAGLVVCHKCDNPGCVNPHHLFVGTMKDNMVDKMLKGRAKSGMAGKTHCKYGHEFSEENTRLTRSGNRICRTCERARTEKWRHENYHEVLRRSKLRKREKALGL